VFNHDYLEVYRIALAFDERMCRLVPRKEMRALRDQIERASASVLACIAEGAGRWSPAEKRHFYGIARGSATERVALIDALKNRGAVTDVDRDDCRTLLLSIVRILSKLSAPSLPEPEPEPEP
jgi:four helix bundle protein